MTWRRRGPAAVLCALTLVLTSAPAVAQAPYRHAIGAGLVLDVTQLREDLIAPLRFSGVGGGVALWYRFQHGVYTLDVRGYAAFSVLFDGYGSQTGVVQPGLDVLALRELARGQTLQLALGPWLTVHEQAMFAHGWDDAHAYWTAVTGLGPMLRLQTPGKTRSLSLEAGLVLVALVSRPAAFREYKADSLVSPRFWLNRFVDQPAWTSVHRLQALRLRAAWQSLERGWRLEPWTQLDLEVYSRPRTVASLVWWLGAQVRHGH